MTIEQQFLTISFMGGSSFVIGILFDGYRVLKGKINLPKIVVFFIDILFGIFSAVLSFYLLLLSNNGQFRVIYIIIFFIALFIYYQTISGFFVKLWISFFSLLLSLWNIIGKVIDIFILRPLRLVYYLLFSGLTFLLAVVTFIGSFFTKLFDPLFGRVAIQTKRVSSKLKSRATKKRGFLSRLKKILKWKKE